MSLHLEASTSIRFQVNITLLYNAANVPKSFAKHTDTIRSDSCPEVSPGSVSVLSF